MEQIPINQPNIPPSINGQNSEITQNKAEPKTNEKIEAQKNKVKQLFSKENRDTVINKLEAAGKKIRTATSQLKGSIQKAARKLKEKASELRKSEKGVQNMETESAPEHLKTLSDFLKKMPEHELKYFTQLMRTSDDENLKKEASAIIKEHMKTITNNDVRAMFEQALGFHSEEPLQPSDTQKTAHPVTPENLQNASIELRKAQKPIQKNIQLEMRELKMDVDMLIADKKFEEGRKLLAKFEEKHEGNTLLLDLASQMRGKIDFEELKDSILSDDQKLTLSELETDVGLELAGKPTAESFENARIMIKEFEEEHESDAQLISITTSMKQDINNAETVSKEIAALRTEIKFELKNPTADSFKNARQILESFGKNHRTGVHKEEIEKLSAEIDSQEREYNF